MNDDRWRIIEDLFHRASAVRETARVAFLDEETSGDPLLRAEVESLLAADSRERDAVREAVAGSAESFRVAREEQATGRRVGDYALIRPLGHGGMGMVYLARRADEEFEKFVAIKFARRAFASGPLLRRFKTERRILARLEHPHISRLLDAGATEDGEPFVVMEYVEGEPLDRFCEQRNLTTEQRLRMFIQVCEAVQYAHRNLVVHRDLKPANILVTAGGEPKLLDFGIAKLLEDDEADTGEETSHTARLLTPEYASPEQLRGEAVTIATDVYSLGIVLNVLLTGARPREGAAEGLTGDLRTIVEKAIRPEPAARYATVQELADDIRRHGAGHPVLARPATLALRTRKFVRRNAGRVTAAVIALVALVAVTGFYTVRLTRERDAANVARVKAEQVSGFMVDLFQYVDPQASRGATITARELLDAAAKTLDTALADQPDVRATMLGNIGEVYVSIGLRSEARPLLRRAIELLVARGLGPDEELSVATLNLANASESESERDSLWALAAARADSAGAEARIVGVTARLRIADRLRAYDHNVEAEAMIRQALSQADSIDDRFQDLRSFAEFMLGLALGSQGRILEAEPVARSSYERRKRNLGADEPRTMQSLRLLAHLLYSAGKWEESADRSREFMTGMTQLYGADFAQVSFGAALAARPLRDLGRLAEAESLATLAIETRRRIDGERGFVLATALRVLARVHADQGRLSVAERVAREAVTVMRESVGETWSWNAGARADLADVLFERERYSDSEVFARELVVGDLDVYGDTSVHTAMHRVMLARALARMGRVTEADTLIARAIPILVEGLPEAHPRIAQASLIRAELLLAQGQPEAADSAARHALRVMTTLAPENAAWQAEARAPLGLSLVHTGQTAAGMAMLETALRDASAVRGPAHAATRYAVESIRMAREISREREQ